VRSKLVFWVANGKNDAVFKRTLIALALIATMAPLSTQARPQRGFNSGPYLALEPGVTQIDFDTDQTTGQSMGHDIEPAFGFIFGWNIYDWFSTELQGLYSTESNSGNRVHYASAVVATKYFLILDALTDFPTLRILPFAKAGAGLRASILPDAPGAGDGKVTSLGYGPSVGGGVAFIWKKYFYFGLVAQEDLFFYDEIRQTVNGVPNTLVYKGGFHPSFSALGIIGVHY